jgi:hypothetical protein
MPSNLTGGFFKNTVAIDESFVKMNPVDEDGIFHESFKPKDGVDYFIHVDLAQKHDYFADVRDYIVGLRRKGFKLKLTTFDRWNSHDTMNILEREHGIKTDTLSVANKHCDDFLSIMYDRRLIGPKIDILIKELKELRLIKGKVDHPSKGTKDLSDATCGAIFNAVAHTAKPINREVEVRSWKDTVREARAREEAEARNNPQQFDGVIRPPKPKTEIPDELRSFIDRMRTL